MSKKEFRKKWGLYRAWRKTIRNGLNPYDTEMQWADMYYARNVSSREHGLFNSMWHMRGYEFSGKLTT